MKPSTIRAYVCWCFFIQHLQFTWSFDFRDFSAENLLCNQFLVIIGHWRFLFLTFFFYLIDNLLKIFCEISQNWEILPKVTEYCSVVESIDWRHAVPVALGPLLGPFWDFLLIRTFTTTFSLSRSGIVRKTFVSKKEFTSKLQNYPRM